MEVTEEIRTFLAQSELDDTFEKGLLINPPLGFFERRLREAEEKLPDVRRQNNPIELAMHESLIRKCKRQLEQFKSGELTFTQPEPHTSWE